MSVIRKEAKIMKKEVDLKAGWKGASVDMDLQPEDFEVMDLVLHLLPELRICVLAAKRARQDKVKYPIKKVEDIVKLLHGKKFSGGGHRITEKEIRRFLPP